MIVPYAIAGALLLLAAGSAQGVFHWWRRARMMARWPTVKGKIASSWSMLDGEPFKYDYAVEGRNYVGHRIYWSAGGASTADATVQEIAEKYPPGAGVTVFYDPKRPATAVLEPRSMQNAAISLAFTLAFGFLGLAFLGVALR
jgi:uncharacterized protein DUF3592